MESSLLTTVTSDWFYDLTGFTERPYGLAQKDLQNVYENLTYNPFEGVITSIVTGRKLKYGEFESPTMTEINGRCTNDKWQQYDDCKVSTVVADVTDLHLDPANAGRVFQVASQFNALEMVRPSVKPSHGITRYESDLTQGPACAIACGAGTIYRNYFLQTDDKQLNMAADMLAACSTTDDDYSYSNGYLFISPTLINHIIWLNAGHPLGFLPYNKIRVGVQHNTAVTLLGCNHNVTQVYCSALPLSYYEQKTDLEDDHLHTVAQYVLESAYRSTLGIAIENNQKHDIPEVYLTLLGGDAFGNRFENIMQSIVDAMEPILEKNGLDIKIVCYTKDIQLKVDAFLKDCI